MSSAQSLTQHLANIMMREVLLSDFRLGVESGGVSMRFMRFMRFSGKVFTFTSCYALLSPMCRW